MLYDYGSIIDWDVKSPFKLKGKYAFRKLFSREADFLQKVRLIKQGTRQ